jgi:RNA 2',3'-cyclic 3'-phosphodiesterase
MRTFISVELPAEVKKNLVELIAELKKSDADVKWVKEENLHLTLKFLGQVDDKQLDKLVELTAKAVGGSGGFKAKFKGLGTFPSLPAGRHGGKSPRVVWVGTAEGGDELCNLAQNLEKALSQAGFKSEAREFKPHLTIGRVKQPGQLVKRITEHKNAQVGEASIDRIFIMKSTLTRSGPVYEIFKEVKL